SRLSRRGEDLLELVHVALDVGHQEPLGHVDDREITPGHVAPDRRGMALELAQAACHPGALDVDPIDELARRKHPIPADDLDAQRVLLGAAEGWRIPTLARAPGFREHELDLAQ